MKAPTKIRTGASSLDRDVTEIVNPHNKYVHKIRKGFNNTKRAVGSGGKASGKILESLGDITKFGVEKTAANQNVSTILCGGGALYAALKAVKNITKTIGTFINPKMDATPWLMNGILAILQGGLALGLSAPILGHKSPFMKVIDGKQVVQLKMILGGVLAPLLLSIFNGIGKGKDYGVLKAPGGTEIKEAVNMLNQGIREVTTSTDTMAGNSPTGGGAPGGGLPNIPGLGG